MEKNTRSVMHRPFNLHMPFSCPNVSSRCCQRGLLAPHSMSIRGALLCDSLHNSELITAAAAI